MKFIVLISLFVCAWGLPSPSEVTLASFNSKAKVPQVDGRIVGGHNVDISEYPYQISLLYYHSHICGGSIVSQRWILTAAHCIIANSVSPFTIRVGSSIRNSGGTVASINSIYIHANYDSYEFSNDISMGYLSSPLTYSTTVQPIDLPWAFESIPAGTYATVTGWGTTSEGGSASTQLQAVAVPTVSISTCRSSYGYSMVTDDMLCAGYSTGGYDACQGDSGGPLVSHFYGQIGIVSWGAGCARPNYYGVYASVPYLRNWITTVSGI